MECSDSRTRTCKRCAVEKPSDVSAFSPHATTGTLRGICRECYNEDVKRKRGLADPQQLRARAQEQRRRHSIKIRERNRRYYHANAERMRAKGRSRTNAYRLRHPERVKAGHFRKYGLDESTLKAMKVQQGGRCAACGCNAHLHVDHCHNTNVVRQLLCAACNRALGMALENPMRLRALADYIERHAAHRLNVLATEPVGVR